MKRRRFFQYAGLGSVGFWLGTRDRAFASDPLPLDSQAKTALETFEFTTATVDRAGRVTQRQTHTAQFFPERLNTVERLEMVAIAPGPFWMGASPTEAHAQGQEFPRHRVKLSPFFISRHPITQAQWAAVASLPKVQRDLNPSPSHFQGDNHPIESISWLDAVEFCDRLSQHTGRRYHLPSEAQWEYACRAGTQTPFNTGETITAELADYLGAYTYKAEAAGEYCQSTLPVGRFTPNAFGLHDMHGNVWEWCSDSWRHNYRETPTDNQIWIGVRQPQMRAIRGGGWLDAPARIRSASRSGYLETALNRTIGLRVVAV